MINFPSLIFNITIEQHQDILTLVEVMGPLPYIAHIHAKLFEGHHLLKVDYAKKKIKEKMFDTMTLLMLR